MVHLSNNAEHVVDEETALLASSRKNRKPTPLPWLQITIVLLLQITEPITSLSIYPYINQLVSELDITGGEKRKVGYYAGLIESLFFITEAMTVLQWSRVSDHLGRKPILLTGLFGLTASMLSFGLSKTFWGLVISRCLCGLLNGNIGVVKSVMGELTDSTNRAEGFAFMPVVWATGVTLGPLMGGVLSRPAERFPSIFGGTFWKEYPYFLPCLATSVFVFIAFTITLIFFKETAPDKCGQHSRISGTRTTQFEASSYNDPIPLRDVFVYPVILSVSNYMSLSFLNISLNALLPLFLAMPLAVGGLGFDPVTIGYIMGVYGICTGLFQAFYFSRIIRYFGERNIFVAGIACFLPIFAIFPVISLTAQSHGVTVFTWVCIALVVLLMSFLDMSFGSIFMFITASTPSKRTLGATNGLSQTAVSTVRAIGPAMTTSLFAASAEHNLLWGFAVYAILFVFACLAIFLALCLPHKVWQEADS